MTSQQKTGTAGEAAAADYLERQGLTVLERNFAYEAESLT
jgi:Holliday junction resolvase-like predicted endonuclease